MITDEFAHRIARLPRLQLGFFPTPVHELPRMGAILGVRLFVKRDDQSGLALGGNKVRMLEFTAAEALAKDADSLVAAAFADSNHCRLAAAAGARLGLPVHLVLGVHESPVRWHGNLLLDHLLGGEVTFVPASSLADVRTAADARVAQLRAAGRRPYLLTLAQEPRALGTIAHAASFLELNSQLDASGIDATHIYVSSAGNTYAGLLLGARVARPSLSVVGISPVPGRRERERDISDLLDGACRLIEVGHSLGHEPAVSIDDDFAESYGVSTSGGIAALLLTARTEGLLLDPVYTAKGMAGLLSHVRDGRIQRGATVVFVHTGGIPGIFATEETLAPK